MQMALVASHLVPIITAVQANRPKNSTEATYGTEEIWTPVPPVIFPTDCPSIGTPRTKIRVFTWFELVPYLHNVLRSS